MKNKILILSLLIAVMLAGNVQAAGLGISPSIVQLDSLARGNTYTEYYKVLNLNDFDQGANIEITGPAKDWITIRDIETDAEITDVVIIPKDSSIEFKVDFAIPSDAPNGVYEGFLDIRPTTATGTTGTGGKVTLIVRGFYRLDVSGEEIIDGKVESIVAVDTESGQLARIYYDFRNTGNVGVTTTANINIYKDDTFVDSLTETSELISAGLFETIDVNWDTENRGTGEFKAIVKITLDSNVIAEKDVTFNIAPRGTYTVEGLVSKIEGPRILTTGEVGKSTVRFSNSGKIDVTAKIVAEVYKDGKLVDVINGDEVLVNAGRSDGLIFYFKPESEGEYTIKAKVLYSGKEQSIDEYSIKVFSEEETAVNKEDFSEKKGKGFPVLAIIGVVVLVGLIIYGFKSLDRRH